MAILALHAPNCVDIVLFFPDGTKAVFENAEPEDLEFAAKELRALRSTIQCRRPDIPPHGESS